MATKKAAKSPAQVSPTDYKMFPGPFSMNTLATKNPKKGAAKPKKTPTPKKSKTNPGF